MDNELDNIRLGDNVVWRVSNLNDFRLFVDPYVKQAIVDKRNIIYFRFASHAPLVEEQPGIRIINVPLSHRFETFTVQIHNIIEKEGYDAFYVFDCLSELPAAWSTDLMMSNFFRVTCPYLFSLNTVAFFPIIRGMHSFQAIAKIRDTTQIFLDVYSDNDGNIYVRPGKVWNRYSETMFLPHQYRSEDGTFSPILDGVNASRFYQAMNQQQRTKSDQNIDSWERFFSHTKLKYENGMDVVSACDRICNIMMTRDEKLRSLIKAHFKPDDYFDIKDHMIGTGMIGGKACGMLLARKLVEDLDPDLFKRLEPHDSYYIGSDVYYSYIVENGFWNLRVRQRTDEEYFSLADTIAEKIMEGEFPRELDEHFIQLLEYYGQDPIIVRSSSILEDGFGNAFAGKYESVFCANNGSMEERLDEFKNAIRVVYASTMSRSALDYRKRRGLDKRDEQMAILVQRVSGSHYGVWYMPCAAGVGYSYSSYRILKDMDPSAGMLRLVMGLGISAVDRTEGSYPRLVNLDRPEVISAVTIKDKHRYSQRGIEVVNKTKRQIEQIRLNQIEDLLPPYLQKMLLEHDTEAEQMFRNRGQYKSVRFISCAGLVKKKELMQDMKHMLHLLQEAYGYPVDIEFTINLVENGEYVINLLQCRPLQVSTDMAKVSIPENIPEDSKIIETAGTSMGLSCDLSIDRIVYVDPIAYYHLPYNDKNLVAQAVSAVNWQEREHDQNMILIVPGRIGTSSPELGVPTQFSDISAFRAIFEVAEDSAGYNPELSYGSHIFQDLVEANILYVAVFQTNQTLAFNPKKLSSCTNLIKQYVPDLKNLENVIGVYDTSDKHCQLYHDMHTERVVCTLGK